MNLWEVLGALTGVAVLVGQTATFIITVMMRNEVSNLKVYMHEKFVTKENAANMLQQVNESTERLLVAVSDGRVRARRVD